MKGGRIAAIVLVLSTLAVHTRAAGEFTTFTCVCNFLSSPPSLSIYHPSLPSLYFPCSPELPFPSRVSTVSPILGIVTSNKCRHAQRIQLQRDVLKEYKSNSYSRAYIYCTGVCKKWKILTLVGTIITITYSTARPATSTSYVYLHMCSHPY